MEGARTAGYLAIAASLGALLTVFTYIPALVGKINDINVQVRGVTVFSSEHGVLLGDTSLNSWSHNEMRPKNW